MSDVTASPIASWRAFTEAAPTVSAVFRRRHAAANNLVMMATLRSDGFPRISPVEPRLFEDRLWIVGMPGTTKFADLRRDPRFCLHTATVDSQVSEGDAKIFGRVENVGDPDLHERFAVQLYEDIGMDLRGQVFDPFYGALITGASSVAVGDDHMDVTVWTPGTPERVVRKH